MQILQTGQRVTLPDVHVELRLSGAAAHGIIVAFTEGHQPLRLDLADHPLGDLLSPLPDGLTLELGRLPADIHTLAVLHPGGNDRGAAEILSGSDHYAYLGPAGTPPVWLLELYRRNGVWRVRAVGEQVGSFAQLHPALPALIDQANTRARASGTVCHAGRATEGRVDHPSGHTADARADSHARRPQAGTDASSPV